MPKISNPFEEQTYMKILIKGIGNFLEMKNKIYT